MSLNTITKIQYYDIVTKYKNTYHNPIKIKANPNVSAEDIMKFAYKNKFINEDDFHFKIKINPITEHQYKKLSMTK